MNYNEHMLLLICIFCIVNPKNMNLKTRKYNIVLILVDDLRYLTNESIYLSNTQRMSESGINFKYAYAQQAQCTPSRISMFTGRRPDSLHLYDSYSYHVTPARKFTTIPQFFKKRGYNTYAVGKVLNVDKKSCDNKYYPCIWSKPQFHAPSNKFNNAAVCKASKSKKLKNNLICPVDIAKQPNQTLPDIEILNEGIKILKQNNNTPFFLVVGFHKPHIPMRFPKKYLESISLPTIRPPLSPTKPTKMPLVAWHPWMDIRHRDDIQRLHIFFPLGVMPEKWILKIRQSYYAAALFIDDLIGELITHIDRNNTIIIITSDHGFSLGENGLWSKYSNFDVALRVPLIFNIPGMKPKSINMPVELIDLFPTVTALVGLDKNIPKCKHQDKSKLCFDGKSLVPIMHKQRKNKIFTGQPFAFSQCPRPGVKPWGNTCKPSPNEIQIMGYSVRTDRYRYTEWVSFNNTTFKRKWSIIYGYELYDHIDDPEETNNVYSDKDYKQLANRLSKLLRFHVERGIYSFKDL